MYDLNDQLSKNFYNEVCLLGLFFVKINMSLLEMINILITKERLKCQSKFILILTEIHVML